MPYSKMAETPYYKKGLTDAIKDLTKALKCERNVLIDSEIEGITTLGLTYWEDTLATGLRGRYKGTPWTVRWDWDPIKLSHINTEYGKPHAVKAAYMEQSEQEHKAREKLQSQDKKGYLMFTTTVKRVTTDADWNKAVWERQGDAYKRECGKTLRDIWYRRLDFRA